LGSATSKQLDPRTQVLNKRRPTQLESVSETCSVIAARVNPKAIPSTIGGSRTSVLKRRLRPILIIPKKIKLPVTPLKKKKELI